MQCRTTRSPGCDADLRTALQHISILPVPTTIEDLLARLDQQAAASADLTEIVLDARYPYISSDCCEQPVRDKTGLFDPILHTGNNDIVQRPARHNSRLLGVGLFLVCCSVGLVVSSVTTVEENQSRLVSLDSHASRIEHPAAVSFGQSEEAPGKAEESRNFKNTVAGTDIRRDLFGGVRQSREQGRVVSREETHTSPKHKTASRLHKKPLHKLTRKSHRFARSSQGTIWTALLKLTRMRASRVYWSSEDRSRTRLR
jgi:hypothetical protein